MSDERLFAAFRHLDRPIEPNAAFGERLFEDLAIDLGFRTSPRTGLRRWLPPQPLVRASTRRFVYLAAILGLLLAAVLAATLVGSRVPGPRTPEDIVRASQAVQADPPAYDMEIRADDGRILRVRMDGHGAWRWDRIADPEFPAGSYEVHATGQMARFDPIAKTWALSPDDRAVVHASALGWQLVPVPTQNVAPPISWFICPDWQRLADAVVADRAAYHLQCGAREFWVDQESSLLVGVSTPAGQELAGLAHARATSLVLAPAFAPDTFALTTPAGAHAYDANNPPASTVLNVGALAPRLSGTTLDGQPFDTTAQSTPLAVYVWATWCPPCLGDSLADIGTVAERHATAVTTVTIAWNDDLGAVTGYMGAKGVRLRVVLDADGSMLRTWGLSAIPALVMLDATGAVAALRLGPVTPADLEEMYADLAAGKPISTPAPTATPSSGSAATRAPGATETVTGLAPGDPAPAWSGPLLTGGTLDSSALAGKPTVLWFGGLGCADCPTADLEAFEAAYRQAGAAANFVIVASGEATPGFTAALFRRLAITVPLVFDWDHRIASAFRMNVLGTVILDRDGRVAYASPGALSVDDLVGLTQKLGPTPTPTGS